MFSNLLNNGKCEVNNCLKCSQFFNNYCVECNPGYTLRKILITASKKCKPIDTSNNENSDNETEIKIKCG